MNNTFSENLKKIRKDNHLSQEELAEKLGVSRQAVSKWESSAAYPEMDKIIQICDMFNLNIDDLLHRDVKEAKGEVETKNKINKTIDDFFNFLTNTVNMFENMNFKSKIKCLFEQCVIALILFIAISIIYATIGSLITNIFYNIFPTRIHSVIISILDNIFLLFAVIFSIIIMVHIFKVRYLDYFEKIKKRVKEENKPSELDDDTDKQNEANRIVSQDNKNKISFKNNEEKIIIRDPSHSEYKFINSMFKLIILGVKFCALWVELGLCFSLITIMACAVASFVIAKSGIFFLGLITLLLSAGVFNTVMVLLLFNFIFDRKNDKKKMIWSSIISIIVAGLGLGLIFIGTLNFNFKEKNPDKVETVTFEMKANTFIDNWDNDIEYVIVNEENNTSTIKIEYQTYEGFEIHNEEDANGRIVVWSECENPMKMIREFISDINNKEVINYDQSIGYVKLYASSENIKKIQENRDKYYSEREAKERENEFNAYRERLDEKDEEIEQLEEKRSDLEDRNYELEEKIENYKSKISDLQSKIYELEEKLNEYE